MYQEQRSKWSPREPQSHSDNGAAVAALRSFCRTVKHGDQCLNQDSWTRNTTRKTNTHFFSKHQGSDDVTGGHSKIFRQIHGAALIVDQHLYTVAFRYFILFPAVDHMMGSSSCPVTFLRWSACLSITLCNECLQQRCRALWTRRRRAFHSSV